MNPNPESITISSDSSSHESWDTTPFPPYLPSYRPQRFGSRTKEQARKFKHDINAPILASLATIKPVAHTSTNRRSNQPRATPSQPPRSSRPPQPSQQP